MHSPLILASSNLNFVCVGSDRETGEQGIPPDMKMARVANQSTQLDWDSESVELKAL